MNLLKYMQILSFVLPVAFLSCSNDTIEDVHYTPQTKIGQKLLAGSETVARVYTDTSFVVALGVTETDVHFQKADSRSTHIFIIDIDLNEPGVSLEVGMPYDADVRNNFQRQTLTEMADYADRPWHRVAAMINADFWDVSTMDIRGPIHRNGVILKNSFIFKETLPQQALSFYRADERQQNGNCRLCGVSWYAVQPQRSDRERSYRATGWRNIRRDLSRYRSAYLSWIFR